MRIVGLILVVAFASLLVDGLADGDRVSFISAVFVAVFLLMFVWTPTGGEKFRWERAITNRRVLVRSGAAGADYEAIALTNVEIAEPRELPEPTTPEVTKLAKLLARLPDDDFIALRHDERIFAFHVGKQTVERIRDAIEAAKERA